MKTIKIMIKDTKKKAFTLIELLIVVAIIGILAGVGVPMYNGYMADAKVKSSQTNHKNIKSFVAATLTKCATGATSVVLGSSTRYCNQSVSSWSSYFRAYFDSISKNPYGGAVTSTASSPAVGQTGIYYATNPNRIRLRTNTGSGYAPTSGYDYVTKE
jgi:type IV pilus assembly protein PilA